MTADIIEIPIVNVYSQNKFPKEAFYSENIAPIRMIDLMLRLVRLATRLNNEH